MRVGILETGRVNEALVPVHGAYPPMFADLFGPAFPESATFPVWPVIEGVLPDAVTDADVWIVIGSKHGVYDPLPWIPPLKSFLRDARSAGVPIIGVCFGHQIVAEAFGGRAEKSDRGWGVGVHRYAVAARPGWMRDAPDEIALHAMHQDQVTAIPDDATVLAGNDHCPFAMLAYGNPEVPDAISIQPHPEFSGPYARDLIERRLTNVLSADQLDAAYGSLGGPVHNAAVAAWAARYLERALGTRVPAS